MISAVTTQGLLRFSTHTGSLTGARFIEFCRKLMHDTAEPVYLVLDGHPTHRSKLVKEFVASTDGRCARSCYPPHASHPASPSARGLRTVRPVHSGSRRSHSRPQATAFARPRTDRNANHPRISIEPARATTVTPTTTPVTTARYGPVGAGQTRSLRSTQTGTDVPASIGPRTSTGATWATPRRSTNRVATATGACGPVSPPDRSYGTDSSSTPWTRRRSADSMRPCSASTE